MLNEYFELPLNLKGLFLHPIKISDSDIKFFEYILNEIKNGKGKTKNGWNQGLWSKST